MSVEIKLKKFLVSKARSINEVAWTASLYIDGKRAGKTGNQGLTGTTEYQSGDQRGKALIQAAEVWCKGLPPCTIQGSGADGKQYTFGMDLKMYIDQIVDVQLNKREQQRFHEKREFMMTYAIVYGEPGADEFQAFELPAGLKFYFNYEKGIENLARAIRENVLPVLENHKIILNTNIPEQMRERLGIPADKITLVRVNMEEGSQVRGLKR
jgi:hypothetical protein